MKLSLKERRFLIVWFSIHCLAIFVNAAKIEVPLAGKKISPIINLFTTNHIKTDGFWPFVPFARTGALVNMSDDATILDLAIATSNIETTANFLGIFYGYDVVEFISFSVIGLCIIFFPKIWGTKTSGY